MSEHSTANFPRPRKELRQCGSHAPRQKHTPKTHRLRRPEEQLHTQQSKRPTEGGEEIGHRSKVGVRLKRVRSRLPDFHRLWSLAIAGVKRARVLSGAVSDLNGGHRR
jgi:hypothetical protein